MREFDRDAFGSLEKNELSVVEGHHLVSQFYARCRDSRDHVIDAFDREPAHLAATFRRVYGQSVGATLRRLRLEAARRCLEREPDCTLADAALRAGFADQSHFTRHFGRLFGVTPGAYRRRQRGA